MPVYLFYRYRKVYAASTSIVFIFYFATYYFLFCCHSQTSTNNGQAMKIDE
jgi:hypothetical protein